MSATSPPAGSELWTPDSPIPLRGESPAEGQARKATDLEFWSVTTIIGILDKAALVPWAANATADAALDDRAIWGPMAEKDRKDARKWLANARYRNPEGSDLGAAELGTAVHAACEEYAITGIRPETPNPEVSTMVDRFDEWAQTFQPAYQAAEVTVYHPDHGYAGTTDGFLTIGGVRWIIDYKTTRKARDYKDNPTAPYPEVALQLAAYRYAKLAAVWRPRTMEQFRRRYYLLGTAEKELAVPVPEVDAGLCIHITPEACTAHPVLCDETIFRAFLYLIEAAFWKFEQERTVIGPPLLAPTTATPKD